MEQVAVGGMEFDEVEPGVDGTAGRSGEGGDHLGDIVFRHLLRFGQLRIRDGAGTVRRPSAVGFGDAALRLTGEWTIGAGLAAGVSELDADDAALRMDEVDDSRP